MQGESKTRLSTNSYLYFILLFVIASLTKWFYLAQQNYYIALSDEMPGAYNLAANSSVIEILRQIFISYNYTFGSMRPFLTEFLYTLAFKLGGFRPNSVFLLGILLGSLLVPLYYFIIARLLSQEIALFSAFVLIFMGNYVWQSLTLTTVIPGTIFLALTLVFATNHYKKHSFWKLFLSGFFLAMSVFSRYENALFIPFFIFYNLLFDKKTKISLKAVYWLICLSSSIYICVCNLKIHGNPLYFIDKQSVNALKDVGSGIGFLKAGLKVWEMLRLLLVWPIWALGLGGICVALLKYKKRALVIISAFFVFLAVLSYKTAKGTLPPGIPNHNYFFILALFILPLAFEFSKTASLAVFKKNISSHIFLGLIAGLLVFRFHHDNLMLDDYTLKYPKELVGITEDLKSIPYSYPLYIGDDLHGFSMLFYLGRNPAQTIYWGEGKLGEQKINEKSFYLLIAKDRVSKVIGEKKVLVKDYRKLGLYKIDNFINEN